MRQNSDIAASASNLHSPDLGVTREMVAERFDGLKRQIPLLYAVIAINIAGFHLATAVEHRWAMIFAGPVSGLIVHRLIHWRRVQTALLAIEEMQRELDRNLRFSRLLSILFLAWSTAVFITGGRDQQQYVVLFASLASVGCAIAMASVPRAARQPLMIIGVPVTVLSALTGEVTYLAVSVSLAIVIVLVSRMLQNHERALISLVHSNAAIASEREKLRLSEERYKYVSRATNDLIWDWDLTSDQLVWSEAVSTQLGYAPTQVNPTIDWWIERIHPDHVVRVVEKIRGVIAGKEETFVDEYLFCKADGSYAYMYDRGYILRDATGKALRMVGAMQDFTRRKSAEENLVLAANRDHLTGLPNRGCFRGELDRAVQQAVSEERRSSLLLLDLDNFKQVNDSLGHDAGDALLKELSARLSGCTAGAGKVARLGGDEFAIILDDVADKGEIEAWAGSTLANLKKPFGFRGSILDCSATFGAAIFPDHGATPEAVLKNADIALYAAKAEKRGGVSVFTPAHRKELQRRSRMLSVASSAVREGRITPFYQPKVSLRDGTLIGFEALLRWRDPVRGIQAPSTISAAFDDLEVATAISDCMIASVLRDVREWLERGVPFGRVAINAAAAEFRQDAFAEALLGRLREAGLPPTCLELEVTETVFVGRGAEHVGRALRMLSDAGLSIALDDFGTGYASLRHLKEFPVDVIKIDRGFVGDMIVDAENEAIVSSVINLSRGLGIKVVAEGVETAEQAERLEELGCDYAQGFLYSKAMPASRVPAFVHRGLTAAALKLEKVPRSRLRLVSN